MTVAHESGSGVTVVVAEPEQIGQPLQVDSCGLLRLPPTQHIVASSPVPDTVFTAEERYYDQSFFRRAILNYIPLMTPGQVPMLSACEPVSTPRSDQ